jgi:hypothetical protein
MKALSITYITVHNWIRLLSEYNLKPSDQLQFTLTNMPELILVAFKRRKEKDWIRVMESEEVQIAHVHSHLRRMRSRVTKLQSEIKADQRQALLSRTSVPPPASAAAADRAPAPAPTLALALTAAASQSDPAQDWALTASGSD